METKTIKALEKIELLYKRRKLHKKLDCMVQILEENRASLTKINDELKHEDFLVTLFIDSLGEFWKEDFIKLITEESEIEEANHEVEKLAEKVNSIANAIQKALKECQGHDFSNFKNIYSLKHQIDILKQSLDE